MLVDYHTHHERCGHAVGRLEEYVESAIAKGYRELGLSDHMPLIHVDPATYLPEMAMAASELPVYVEECFALKARYANQIDLRVGLEADYIEGYESDIRAIVEGYQWDYVIGSVHFLGTWDITDYRQKAGWDERVVDEVHHVYYDAIAKAAASGFYDIIGHFDVVKRFSPPTSRDMFEEQKRALEVIASAGVAMELNASGLNTPAKEMFPSRRVLEQAKQLGIVMTLGSDAHNPNNVGLNLDLARQLLREVGYDQVGVFDQRQRQLVPLTSS